jgi:hypothetical protein
MLRLQRQKWPGLIFFFFPKKEGGLGLKRLKVWNQTSMLRHIFSIFARSGSLWVAWIKENFLKQKSFWSVGIPQNCSWCWRKILKLSNITKKFLRFEVGDGKTIHLWLDCWHPAGILLDIYGYRAGMMPIVVWKQSCLL